MVQGMSDMFVEGYGEDAEEDAGLQLNKRRL